VQVCNLAYGSDIQAQLAMAVSWAGAFFVSRTLWPRESEERPWFYQIRLREHNRALRDAKIILQLNLASAVSELVRKIKGKEETLTLWKGLYWLGLGSTHMKDER
jgi:hypothetical protein